LGRQEEQQQRGKAREERYGVFSRDVVAKIEDGRRWVAGEELIKLAKALACPVPALFPQEDQEVFKLSSNAPPPKKRRKK